jgi:hypothetical protein
VAITVLGVWLWQRHDPPSPDDLQAIEGRITEPTFRRTKYGGRNVRFRIEGSDRQFSYVDWYPNASLVADAIRDGERITVWVDRRDPSQTPEVWRLQAGDGFIVGYDALVEARPQQRQDWAGPRGSVRHSDGCGDHRLGARVVKHPLSPTAFR